MKFTIPSDTIAIAKARARLHLRSNYKYLRRPLYFITDSAKVPVLGIMRTKEVNGRFLCWSPDTPKSVYLIDRCALTWVKKKYWENLYMMSQL